MHVLQLRTEASLQLQAAQEGSGHKLDAAPTHATTTVISSSLPPLMPHMPACRAPTEKGLSSLDIALQAMVSVYRPCKNVFEIQRSLQAIAELDVAGMGGSPMKIGSPSRHKLGPAVTIFYLNTGRLQLQPGSATAVTAHLPLASTSHHTASDGEEEQAVQ